MSKLLTLTLISVAVLYAPSNPTISVSPWEDGVQISVHLPTDKDNRYITIAYQGLSNEAVASVSGRELQGEDSPSIVSSFIRTLPKGSYVAVASVYNAKGKRISGASREFFK